MTGRELIEALKLHIKPQIATPQDEWAYALFHAGALHAVQAAERILQEDETGSYTEQLTAGWITRRS